MFLRHLLNLFDIVFRLQIDQVVGVDAVAGGLGQFASRRGALRFRRVLSAALLTVHAAMT